MEAGQDHHVLVTTREPLGVIACVIPFNFPCDLFGQKVAPALLAGNAAIIKPSTDNPLTLCKLTAMLGEAGVIPGAVQIVTGRGSKVGSWLCGNKDVLAITLTGSTEVGIETARTAADHLAHIALELGGNDAFIVLEDGDVDLAAEELIWGRMYNTGQVCCASKRFLIQKNRAAEFTEKAINRISCLKQGMPSEETTLIFPDRSRHSRPGFPCVRSDAAPASGYSKLHYSISFTKTASYILSVYPRYDRYRQSLQSDDI